MTQLLINILCQKGSLPMPSRFILNRNNVQPAYIISNTAPYLYRDDTLSSIPVSVPTGSAVISQYKKVPSLRLPLVRKYEIISCRFASSKKKALSSS